MESGLRILITGSSGLVGSALRELLEEKYIATSGFDMRGGGADRGDVRDRGKVRQAVRKCEGVVHLAAISRVVIAEQQPELCWSTNVNALSIMLEEIAGCVAPPWLLFVSSREVYGDVAIHPAREDTPLRPVNVYGRSKAEGEFLCNLARERGLRTAIVRLSNVYGTTTDHADRVIPAFARAAAKGGLLRVEGGANAFDFTHLDDVVQGLMAVIGKMMNPSTPPPPPIHFLTGKATTLEQLATWAVEFGKCGVSVIEAPPRAFDVTHFVGDPSRAKALLGWEPYIDVLDGFRRLTAAYSRC